MEAERFTYPLSKLILRLAPVGGLFLIFVLATLRASRPDHGNPALFAIPFFAFITILPTISLLAKYSSIIISDWGVKAQTLGIVWRKVSWKDIGYIQRVRAYREPAIKQHQLGEVYYFGRGSKGTWRISFTPEIRQFERILRCIDEFVPANGVTLYAIDSPPKSYGQVRVGAIVEKFRV